MPTDVDLTRFDQLAVRVGTKKKACPIGFVLRQLDKTKATEFESAAAMPLYGNNVILAWLEEEGHKGISNSAMTSHRKRTCTCYG